MPNKALNELCFKHLWDNADSPAFIFTPEGDLLDMNRFAKKTIGRAINELDFKSVFLDFHDQFSLPELCKEEKAALMNLNTGGDLPLSFYFRFYRKQGNILTIGERGSLETDRLQKQMVELNSELNVKTRELFKANAELQKLNTQKNEFIGIAAHDLRNPIASILMYSDFLIEEYEEKLSPDQIKILNTIKNQSEFMLHLLNDLLDISKIELGKLDLQKEVFAIDRLILENIRLNQSLADKKDIKIVFTNLDTIPKVNADINKIRQVFTNLLTNAIKYSSKGSKVEVNVFSTGKDIAVGIKDEGIGIPLEEQDKIFKPFSTTSAKPTDGEKSTGLGLVIVKRIIIGHQGKIWFESQPGKGTTFYFSLPINQKPK